MTGSIQLAEVLIWVLGIGGLLTFLFLLWRPDLLDFEIPRWLGVLIYVLWLLVFLALFLLTR